MRYGLVWTLWVPAARLDESELNLVSMGRCHGDDYVRKPLTKRLDEHLVVFVVVHMVILHGKSLFARGLTRGNVGDLKTIARRRYRLVHSIGFVALDAAVDLLCVLQVG